MNARAWRQVVRFSLLGLLFAASGAQAVISCNVSATSVLLSYNPAGATDLVASGMQTISCTRAGGDPATVGYSLAANTGLNPQGQNNRVRLAATASYYNYALFKDASLAAGQRWGTAPPAAREFSGTIDFGVALTVALSTPFYLQVPTGQPVGPAGIYTDTVTMTLTYGTATALGAFSVNVNSITSCTLAVPASVTFNYTSFQAAPAAASASFTVNCTTGLPYTMALDTILPITDDAVNLSYSLSLSAAGGTGTGVDVTHAINGTMAAGQSGTCATAACSNAAATNKTRTLTVTW